MLVWDVHVYSDFLSLWEVRKNGKRKPFIVLLLAVTITPEHVGIGSFQPATKPRTHLAIHPCFQFTTDGWMSELKAAAPGASVHNRMGSDSSGPRSTTAVTCHRVGAFQVGDYLDVTPAQSPFPTRTNRALPTGSMVSPLGNWRQCLLTYSKTRRTFPSQIKHSSKKRFWDLFWFITTCTVLWTRPIIGGYVGRGSIVAGSDRLYSCSGKSS